MLMYGEAKVADIFVTDSSIMIYNLTSLAERYGGSRLPIIPPNSLGANTEYEYDVKYMEWIFGNEGNFMNFMRIIHDLYQGISVFLVTSDDGWSDMFVESLLKLIQQRYGIVGAHIENYEDYTEAEDSGFEPFGLANLDQDLLRYQYNMAMIGGIKGEE